jgi:hypothetical protein
MAQQALEETLLAGEVVVEVEVDSMTILLHHTPIIDRRRSPQLDPRPRDMLRHETRERGDQVSGLGLVLAVRPAMLWATEVATRMLAASLARVLRPEIQEDSSVDKLTMEKEVHGQVQDLLFLLVGMKAQASDRRVVGDPFSSRMK